MGQVVTLNKHRKDNCYKCGDALKPIIVTPCCGSANWLLVVENDKYELRCRRCFSSIDEGTYVSFVDEEGETIE